ncbi:MAG: FAD-dependent oxidoreductase [Anaerolineae bacterium]
MTDHQTATNGADVVIVGGGIVGCATAYYLAQRGVDVLLIERRGIGSGASGRSGGGVRQSARVTEEIPLAMESVALFPALSDELGMDLEYTCEGNLRLVEIPDHIRPMQVDIDRQQKLGLDVRWLDPDEVREIVPALKGTTLFGASYCPTDGHVNPFRLVTGFYQAAQRAGARALIGQEVRSVRQTDSGQALVEVGDQLVRASTVVIAAGPGSQALCLKLGFDLPLATMCYESMITEALPPVFPQMFGVATGDLFFRQTRHGGVHFGGGTIQEIAVEQTSGKNLHLAIEHLTRLVPQLREVSLLRTWGGLDPSTPDGRPIIDRLNENALLATGFCGHGLAVGPIVGRYLAEWIAGGEKPEILAPFGRDRFRGFVQTRWTPSGSFEAAIITDVSLGREDGGEPEPALSPGIQEVDIDEDAGPRLLAIEPGACTGCRMCEIACAIQHEQMARQTQLHIQVVSTSDDFFLPIMCIHCEEAYCLENCFFDALEYDERNIIQVIDDNCTGCLLCVEACPYGGITYIYDRETVIKCDLCGGRPACAMYCPTGAITFAPLDEPTWDRMKAVIVDNLWARVER